MVRFACLAIAARAVGIHILGAATPGHVGETVGQRGKSPLQNVPSLTRAVMLPRER